MEMHYQMNKSTSYVPILGVVQLSGRREHSLLLDLRKALQTASSSQSAIAKLNEDLNKLPGNVICFQIKLFPD